MTIKYEVTAIIPVYNGEKYLIPFLNSLKQQELSDFEMIFVDDASIDKTPKILESFWMDDQRVCVYHNTERRGAAYSRNFGMKKAQGKFLCFLDADDVVDPEHIAELFKTIKQYSGDIVYCDADRHYDSEKKYISKRKRADYKKFNLRCTDVKSALCIPHSPPVFMIDKTFIKKYQLTFQNLRSSNDVYFFEMAKMLAESIIYVNVGKPLYHIRQHQTASRISSNRDPMDAFFALERICHKLHDISLWSSYEEYFYARTFKCLYYAVLDTKDEKIKKEFLHFLKNEGLLKLGLKEEFLDTGFLSLEVQYLLSTFMQGNYTEIEELNELKVYIKANSGRLKQLFFQWSEIKVAFWGVGARWEWLYQECKDYMLFSYCLIDKRKAGEMYHGCRIYSYQELENKVDMIVILNTMYRDEIIKEVREHGGRESFFDLEKYLTNS